MISPAKNAGFGSAVTNLKIRAKIGLLSGRVLIILAGLAVKSYVSLETMDVEFSTYSQHIGVVDIARIIERDDINLRQHVRVYALTGAEASAVEVRKAATELQQDFD